MRIRKAITVAAFAVFAITQAAAQESSINTFSPFSLYGLGELSLQGTTNIRAMGGAGTAYRDITNQYMVTLNYINPAAYSVIPRKSFLFNFGFEAKNSYFKDGEGRKTSYNTANVRDVDILLPVWEGIGASFSITPFSSVGYRMQYQDMDPQNLALGKVVYHYQGEGDITQVKIGAGWEVWKNRLSVGLDGVYYVGSIYRYYDTDIYAMQGGSYTSLEGTMTTRVSKLFWKAGVQYNIFNTPKKALTLGATYQMGGKLNADETNYIPSNDFFGTAIINQQSMSNLEMPDMISAGINYQTAKMSVGADYTFSNWGTRNDFKTDAAGYTNTNSFKAGVQYTPDRLSVRNVLKRATYMCGARYEDSYITYNGQKINDLAFSVGVGIPIRLNFVNFALEYGHKGNTDNGMVREDYFKFSIGLSFLGENWFMKRKFD